MKFWECVAIIYTELKGHPRRHYALFEDEVRDVLRMLPVRRSEANKELSKKRAEKLIREGLELMALPDEERRRLSKRSMEERISRN